MKTMTKKTIIFAVGCFIFLGLSTFSYADTYECYEECYDIYYECLQNGTHQDTCGKIYDKCIKDECNGQKEDALQYLKSKQEKSKQEKD